TRPRRKLPRTSEASARRRPTASGRRSPKPRPSLTIEGGGADMAPTPRTLGAPRETRGAPREPMPKLLMLPPQSPKTREWAARVKAGVPGLEVVVAEDAAAARAAIADADCAFGTLPADLLGQAKRLRWLQAPQAAPP